MNDRTRRTFLRAAVIGGASTLVGCVLGNPEKEEVSPTEDLMREHGVLKRVLLIYDEAIRRIDANEDLPPDAVMDSAKIIRSFIEDYHEKLEEEFLFPRFNEAELVDLVGVLFHQHQAGRKLTDITMQFATNQALKNAEERRQAGRFVAQLYPHVQSARGAGRYGAFPGFSENCKQKRIRLARRSF